MWIPNVVIVLLISLMVAYTIRHYIFSFQALFGRRNAMDFEQLAGKFNPEVTVLVPAHDEESVIGLLLQRLTHLTYPKDRLRVVVVDDRSTDKTFEIASEFARNFRFVKVLKRTAGNGGKSGALNFGLERSNGEIIVTFDADYYPQKDIIEKLVAPFLDPTVGAVQGRVTVLNENQSYISKIVTLERIAGYRVDQLARDDLNLLPQYGGTVAAVRRRVLEEVGGWDPLMLTEDTDLTFACLLGGYKVRYVKVAESYEEAVTTWSAYWKQRYRWAKGHTQVLFKYLVPLWLSKQFGFKEKIEFTMLLGVYLLPVMALLGWIFGLYIYFTGSAGILPYYFGTAAFFTLSSVGNFAPFFEVGVAAYLDRRPRVFHTIPLLFLPFLLNMLLCTKALLSILFHPRKEQPWGHTRHIYNGKGTGTTYGSMIIGQLMGTDELV